MSIEDDDDPQVTVSFGQASYSVDEGNDVIVAVTLSADPERTVTVTLTKVDQGGATSDDYSNVPASVTFNAGETRKEITFTADPGHGERRRRERSSWASARLCPPASVQERPPRPPYPSRTTTCPP